MFLEAPIWDGWTMHDLIKQFLKHSVVGSVAFLVDFALLVATVETLHWNPLPASVFSYLVSGVVSYLGSMKFVFESRDDLSRRKEFVVFMVLSLIGLMLNSLCMWVGQEILRSQGINWVEGVYYMIVKVLATAIVTFYNFFSRRYWLDASRN